MRVRVLADATAVAAAGAAFIAAAAQAAIARRGTFSLAVSGGRTPWLMLRALADCDLGWRQVRIVQVDERVVPPDSPDRNLSHLRAALLAHAPLPPANLYAMPVDDTDLAAAAARYARTLAALAGSPPTLDLVHLGLGADGHTASLVPGDPVLELTEAWVGVTGSYQRHPRMTLTYPVLNRARSLLFVVTGDDKAVALRRLSRRDNTIPAGRITNPNLVVLADRAAAARLEAADGSDERRPSDDGTLIP